MTTARRQHDYRRRRLNSFAPRRTPPTAKADGMPRPIKGAGAPMTRPPPPLGTGPLLANAGIAPSKIQNDSKTTFIEGSHLTKSHCHTNTTPSNLLISRKLMVKFLRIDG
jgi:hypothetical protein